MKLHLCLIFLFTFGATHANWIDDALNVFHYNTDYNLQELFRLMVQGTTLTFGQLFKTLEEVPIEKDVTFWCTNRKSDGNDQVLIGDRELDKKIDASKPIGFLIHGWIDNKNRTWMKETARDWVKFVDTNVCLVDWSRLANYEYSIAARNHTLLVGDYLADFIQYLEKKKGMSRDNITLVGHSLGGQIAGFCGAKLNGTLARIIALDPAGPYFTHPIRKSDAHRLTPDDAKFVQVIYTTAGILGANVGCGHANFYPNGGVAIQPGCKIPPVTDGPSAEIITCSHSMATSFFRHSLNPAVKFIGNMCSSYLSFFVGPCKMLRTLTSVFGVHTEGLHGTFYLTTDAKVPYAKL